MTFWPTLVLGFLLGLVAASIYWLIWIFRAMRERHDEPPLHPLD